MFPNGEQYNPLIPNDLPQTVEIDEAISFGAKVLEADPYISRRGFLKFVGALSAANAVVPRLGNAS